MYLGRLSQTRCSSLRRSSSSVHGRSYSHHGVAVGFGMLRADDDHDHDDDERESRRPRRVQQQLPIKPRYSSSSSSSSSCCSLTSSSNSSNISSSQQQKLPQQQQQQQQQRRHYHASQTKEIVPLIAAGLLFVGVRYSYKAVQRMKADMEDYQYELQQYETQLLKQQQQQTDTTSNNHTMMKQKTIAIDFGTCFMKLAATHPTVQVLVSREGDRSVFNGVVYAAFDDSHDDAKDAHGNRVVAAAVGRAALDRFYYHAEDRPVDVTLPFAVLAVESAGQPLLHTTNTNNNHSTTALLTARQVVSDVLTPRLTEVLDRMEMSSVPNNKDDNKNSTFSADPAGPVVRQVVTLPCAFLANPNVYRDAFADNTQNTQASPIVFVPEPVAAVWGAQFHNLLPDQKDAAYLVIDIGGWTTQLAVVQRNVVLPQHSTTLPWGGEIVIEQLVNVLKHQHQQDSKQPPLNDARSLALLQVQARQAVAELSTRTRVDVHVPYIFADPSHHHLDASVARTVLDQAVERHVRDELVRDLQQQQQHTADTALSPHVPTPTNLTALWTSVITQVLERAGQRPSDLAAVLLVGGGAKSVVAQQTLQSAWTGLTGDGGGPSSSILKRPDPSIQSELTVLGAATLPPSFGYSLTDGLIRR